MTYFVIAVIVYLVISGVIAVESTMRITVRCSEGDFDPADTVAILAEITPADVLRSLKNTWWFALLLPLLWLAARVEARTKDTTKGA